MKFNFTILFFALLILASCTKKEDEVKDAKEDAQSAYAEFVYSSYLEAYNDASDLKESITDFVNNPSASSLESAKEEWLESRESYGPTEAFRFADGPIDVIGTEEGPEGLLNSWPLDEGYIDYVEGSPLTGIINDIITYPTIDKDLLESLNGAGGEENVSVGYHAIEFLLWGQDLTDPSEKIAGQRPYTDYVDGGTALNQDRRRQYLELCADMLLDHLQILLDQWEPSGDYRKEFESLSADEALSKMMTAIATLSKTELAGERMFVAYDNRDQEDEHSCFSDNTHRDIRLNFEGIKQVYIGLSSSIHDIIEIEDEDVADDVKDALKDAEDAVNATAVPFDYAITDDAERVKVLDAVNALRTLGDKIVEGGDAIGVKVDIIN